MDLKKKYPTSHYPPNPDCPDCKGKGEVPFKDRWSPCICLYCDPELLSIVAPAMDTAFRDVLGKNYDK